MYLPVRCLIARTHSGDRSPRTASRPGALGAGQAIIDTSPGVKHLLDPLPHRRLDQIEVPRDLAQRPVPALAQIRSRP